MRTIRRFALIPFIAVLILFAFVRPAPALPGIEHLSAQSPLAAPSISPAPGSPAGSVLLSTPQPEELGFSSAGTSVSAPAALLTATITATITVTPTVTVTPSVTVTPTVNVTPSPSPTPTSEPFAYLPLLMRQDPLPIPVEKVLYCADLRTGIGIPDNLPSGVASQLAVSDSRLIHDLDLTLDINHPYISDLSAYLTHAETGRSIRLFDRPGFPADPNGCGGDNVKAFLDDEVSATVESQCAASPAAVSGIFIPDEPFASFDGESASGVWTLTLVDSFQGDSGILESWCLAATVGGQLPPPTPTPPPPALPPSSRIRNITGQPQALNLDCESRVAVDWAGYFGVYIDELEFFYRLPTSDNPDAGFVGNVHGKWGQVPPNPYGIHAEPVAALLREYGLPAYAHRPLSWDALRAELAAKRPVYVWVIGSVDNGIPEFYRSNDGHLSVVARKEHTVQVIGYNETNVFILDGGTTYSRSIPVFLASWSALGNMAITTQP